MPRFLLATFGSLGDLHPIFALALELRRRGHTAVIATSEPYRARVTALGLPFAPLRPDLSLDNPELVRRVMDGPRGSEYLLRRLVYPNLRDMHADLDRAVAETGADVLVGAELACAVPLVAARRNLPWAYVALSPISLLSAHDPSVLPGPRLIGWLQSLGPRANRAVLALARAASWSWWAPVRSLRRELGLPPGDSPLFAGKYSPHLNLALFSSHFQSPPPDWPAGIVQPGFCFHDEDDSPASATAARPASAPCALPAPVAAFLAAGPAPIVFTLGSAAVQLADDFYSIAARAAAQLGHRALLLLGRNSPPPSLPPSILAWDYLPYARIFPHAAAIVHQGGIGTTAQALRAGRPMLIVPFAHDQFDNAARIARLGVGRTLPRAETRIAPLAAALSALLADTALAARSRTMGDRIRAEDAPALAAAALEGLLRSPPSSPAPALPR